MDKFYPQIMTEKHCIKAGTRFSEVSASSLALVFMMSHYKYDRAKYRATNQLSNKTIAINGPYMMQNQFINLSSFVRCTYDQVHCFCGNLISEQSIR